MHRLPRMRSAVKTALFRPVFAAAAPRAISCVERPPSVFFASTGESENMQQPIAVVAFGGNALLRRGEELTIENQRRNAQTAAKAVANLLDTDFRVCVTHGNGPQVGLLAATDETSGLDVLDAETEGQIGYLLELELANALRDRLDVVTLLTQTVVDPEDPAFQRPTKPIGRWLTHKDAEALRREKGWSVAQDGDRWRRVVPSPKPKAIVEARAVQILLNAGVVVICCGGGGIPVAVDVETGRKRGIEAVVDKDLASAVLASHLGANMLVMLTDQEAIFDPDLWPETKKKMPSPLSCSEARKQRFAEGSMKPKVEAACLFVEQTGGKAAVGKIKDLHAIIKGDAGTLIVAD